LSEPPQPTAGSASQDDAWWQKPDCPAGSERFGAPPPDSTELGCKTPKGKREGRFVRFQGNGKKAEEGQYEDNLAVGLWTTWNTDGTKQLETHYAAGEKNGVETEWYPDGTIKSQRELSHGKRDGLTTIWDESGRKRTAMTYRAGEPHGVEVRWDETGRVAKVIDHGSH
jgi:antitoxin component YwqK of YwqJK toxin-antitoxin module